MNKCVAYILAKINTAITFAVIFLLIGLSKTSSAQFLENIDFEKANFEKWECWQGNVAESGVTNLITWDAGSPGPPVNGRHSILSANPGDGLDKFGSFPKNAPNGSGHSVQLGSDATGNRAEGLSYTFTIPAGLYEFSLYYQYAVVFQNPGHFEHQQPQFKIRIENLTDNEPIPCTIAPFISSILPGFKFSSITQNNASVLYKDWATASIKLNGLAGKKIRLFFITTSCTRTLHFAYAYIDISTKNNQGLDGAVFCRNDPKLTLNAPPLYEKYRWFNSSNTTLSTEQSLIFQPPPNNGDTVYVEATPFNNYGCIDTFAAFLYDTLTVKSFAGNDQDFCANAQIPLGKTAVPGEIYSWSPTIGLSNPHIANPVASPYSTQKYTVTATSSGGGCISEDEVSLVKNCEVIEIFVPTAFTPDGNSTNDYLRPRLYGFSKLNYFRIYNRYGQLLYNGINDQQGWDGKIRGKIASTQTVVWMLEAEDAFGRIHKRQGTTVLLR